MSLSIPPAARRRLPLALGLAAAAALGAARWGAAADHRDSAALTNDRAADIADVYAFRSPADPGNLVLAMTVSGLIPPAESGTTHFDPGVLYQFEIDTDGDAVEDRVIQAFVTGSGTDPVMRFRGPAAPEATGTTARVVRGPETGAVRVSGPGSTHVSRREGMTVFAGVRDDPFFFDLGRFQAVLAGQATGFADPGTDAFAGTNVLAIVVEVPVSTLGGASRIAVWGTTSRP